MSFFSSLIHYDTQDAAQIEPALENSSVTEIPPSMDISQSDERTESPPETSKLLSLENDSPETDSSEDEEEESKVKTKMKGKTNTVTAKKESSSDSSSSSECSDHENNESKTQGKTRTIEAKLKASDDSSDDSVIEIEPVINVSNNSVRKSQKSKEKSPVPSTSRFMSKKSSQLKPSKADKIKSELGSKKITPSRDRPMKATKDFILIRDHTDSDASSTISPRKKPRLAPGKHEVVTVQSDADTITTDSSINSEESEESKGSESDSEDDLSAMAEAAGLTMDALSEGDLSEDSDEGSELMYLGTPDEEVDKVYD